MTRLFVFGAAAATVTILVGCGAGEQTATPARNARDQLLPFLENGEQVVLAEFAHTGDLYYLQPEATRHLLTTFFSTGVVDASHYEPNVVSFKPSWGMPLIAKLVVGGIVLSVTIVALVLLLLVRLAQRIARRRT